MGVGLKIIEPLLVSDSTLTSSNVPEADYPLWVSGTYALAARVIRTQTHSAYECVAAGAGTTAPELDEERWQRVSATNRWAMFDDVNGSITTRAGSIITEITPGRVCNAVALFNLTADSVRVEVIDPLEGVVYDRSVALIDNGEVSDWWTWYFLPIRRRKTLVLTDLPAYGTAKIRITITAASGNAGCGTQVVGRVAEFGYGVEAGAGFSFADFSRKERDRWGSYSLKKGNHARDSKWAMKIPTDEVDAMDALLGDLLSVPCVWIATEQHDVTVTYGIFEDFSVVIPYAEFAECNLTIKGLI